MSLSKLREARRLTLEQVAEILGRSKQCYWNYEKGIRKVPLNVAVQLADIYGVTTESIFFCSKSNQNVNNV